jgi:PAS domain S-box-containing protein
MADQFLKDRSSESKMTRCLWPVLSGYLLALGANLLALVLTHFLSPLLVPSPFPIFVAAIVLSAWFYGMGVGLFSTLVATLVTNFFFLPPLYILTLGKEDVSRLGLFLLVTGIAVSLMQAQKRAAEAQSHLGAIVANSDDAIIGLTLAGLVTSWNAAAARMYGFSSSEIMGHPIFEIVPSEQQNTMHEILARVRSGEVAQPFETIQLQKSERRINTSITISPIRKKSGQITGASMITRDITDRKSAEKKLQEYTEQLQFLSQRLVEVQENERRFIARELHDEIGQTLTGLKLIMEVAPQLPAEDMRAKLGQAQGLVTELMDQVSHLTLDLRPPMLDDLGLLPTLLWHFTRYTDLTHIEIQFKHVGIEKRRFPTKIETAAYRIIQEALTNVARHTSARQVKVWVLVDAQGFNIQILDNGEGFDPQSILSSGKASGLVGIRERAELLGGSFSIQSELSQGTHLEVVFPFDETSNLEAEGSR